MLDVHGATKLGFELPAVSESHTSCSRELSLCCVVEPLNPEAQLVLAQVLHRNVQVHP